MVYLYILFSRSANKYYVGISGDPMLRLDFHNHQDQSNYTSKFRPWEMVALFKVSEQLGEAMKIERYIKKQKSRRLVERLIDPAFIAEGKLAQLVNPGLCIWSSIAGPNPFKIRHVRQF